MLARRIFIAAIAAGLVAGAFVTLVQAFKIWPLIAAAEVYEKAAESRETATAAASAAPDHAAHEHAAPGHAEWEPSDGAERMAFTLAANILVAVGFGLLLCAGFALRHAYGGAPADAMSGTLWGIAGFAAFQLAPSFGLPPELPGSVAAELAARQGWWLITAGGTALGIALLVFSPRHAWRIAGLAAIIAPHLVGAPSPPHAGGEMPPQLAAEFVAASLVTAALFWVVLGGFGGWVYGRLARPA